LITCGARVLLAILSLTKIAQVTQLAEQQGA
jgi:hypothetical protein